MALIEVLHRRVVNMGLVPKLLAFLPILSMLLAFASVSLMAYLPMDGQYRRTYISENALMPSQAYSYFRESEWNILRGYRSQLISFPEKSTKERNHLMGSWLEEIGIKTAIHEDDINGDTLYGVFHAPRGDGTEAMILTVPWYNSDDEFNTSGAALGISLTRYFSRWPVWSKNIIVVFSENPDKSLTSWIDAYHKSLDLTGGSIEAAIVMDYPGEEDYFEYIELYYDGLNGVLPNLDLVNTAVSVIEHEGIKVSLHGMPLNEIDGGSYWSRLRILLTGVKNLALAGVIKSHGNEAFSGWKIQAITLKASGSTGHDVTTFGRIPEGMFRSINNLLEKFHQSFFFYFLLAPRHFISIGSYLPAAVFLSICFAVSALDSFLNNEYSTLPISSIYNLTAMIGLVASIIFSFIVAQMLLHFPQPHLLLLGNIALSSIAIAFDKGIRIPEPLAFRLKSVSFVYFSLALTSLLVIDFPLAFGMGIMAFPLTLVKINNLQFTCRMKIKNTVYLLLSNPFIALWLFVNIFESELKGAKVFYALVSSWKDQGCWTWFVICIGWFPTWILIAISSLNSQTVKLMQGTKKHL